MSPFETALLVFGALLVAGALISGVARRSFLSLTALFVVVGLILGRGGLEVLSFTPRSGFVEDLAVVALIVILFRDGLEVEAEMLQSTWRLPLRKLVVGMPITAVIVAVVAHAVGELDWTQSFLLGALLSPTDPVLSSSVVTNPRVPRVVRHSLNLESGLNDGLALPAVLTFAAALGAHEGDFVWWRFVLQDIGLGLVFGVVVGWIASLLMPEGRDEIEESIPPHQKTLYALGVAFATYGIALLPPHGNGFIAVFVGAITLGIRRPDLRHYFAARAQELVEVVKVGVFLVFGALLTFGGLGGGWAAAAIVAVTLLLARPLALAFALAGTRLDRQTKAFMAWFGPKGVATMTFALLVLGRDVSGGERIFNLAAVTVFCSVILHGLTDTPGANWIGRHSERRERERAAEAPQSVERPQIEGRAEG